VYAGKRLSVWAEEVRNLNRLANIVNTDHPAVQAMRATGTNGLASYWANGVVREFRFEH
jgi:hypothetical protein